MGLTMLARLLVAGAVMLTSMAHAQESPAFARLLADSKEPHLFAAYLVAHSLRLPSRLGTVGSGETVALLEGADWQVAIAGAALAQFDMASTTTDLVNMDFIIGLPVSYRSGAWGTRLRVYHQSSHLGDGFVEHHAIQPARVSFESVEALVDHEVRSWRVYAGGEDAFERSPSNLLPVLVHGGIEWRERGDALQVARLGAGRLVAGLDAKSFQEFHWGMGWSLVAGLELADPRRFHASPMTWSLLVTAYAGPSPYGQFFGDHVSTVGFSVGCTL